MPSPSPAISPAELEARLRLHSLPPARLHALRERLRLPDALLDRLPADAAATPAPAVARKTDAA